MTYQELWGSVHGLSPDQTQKARDLIAEARYWKTRAIRTRKAGTKASYDNAAYGILYSLVMLDIIESLGEAQKAIEQEAREIVAELEKEAAK